MAQNQDSCPDPSQAGDLAGFVELLVRRRAYAGNPSYRALAKKVGPLLQPPRVLSHTTLANTFRPGRRRMDLDLVVAIVRALGADEDEARRWHDACTRIHSEGKFGATATVAVLRQLPAELATFTGRESELKALCDSIEKSSDHCGTVVICAIEGMAGVGKTQLAIRLAHRLVRAGRFQDAQFYVNLRGFDPAKAPANPVSVLGTLLSALEVPAQLIPAGLEECAAMFRDRIHDKSAVLLLDNAADEDQVRHLIPAAPGCLVIVTSRRSMAGLDGAKAYQLAEFSHDEARKLLARIAGRERVESAPTATRQLIDVCGRLPLAVALAAAKLRSRPTWQMTDLVDHLDEIGPHRMRAGGRALHPAFDWSYRALSDEARKVYRLLGIMPGIHACAEIVAAMGEVAPRRAREILEQLHDEHLLRQPVPGRFEIHNLLCAHAAERAAQELTIDEQAAAITRALAWYAATTDAAGRALMYSRRLPVFLHGYSRSTR